jgi:hypothetical protein
MPTYQDALSAHPSEFLTFASEMTAAASDLATQQTEYGTKVSEINAHWRDTANDAFNGEVGNVNTHLSQVIGEVTATAGSLASTAAQMLAECTGLKAADAAIRAVGFNIQPAPMVTLGPAQRTAIAMAGPFGPILEAGLQAQAMAGTFGLQTLTSLINAADATAGAALSQAAELLKPLEDKSNPGKDLDQHRTAQDHSGTGTEGTGEEQSSEEKHEEKEEEEKQGEQPSPEDQQQEPSGAATPQEPAMPEHPTGMEDMTQPEVPGLDDSWDPAELEDPEDISGGLASGGGGLGGGPGGVGTGGLPATGAPAGGGTGTATMLGAPANAPTGNAAKAGMGGGMMGAGGGRGAGGNQDNEVERESFLVEDPEEDVWGIAKAADDLYE